MGFPKPKLKHKLRVVVLIYLLKNGWTYHSLIAALGHNTHNNSILPISQGNY